MMDVLVFTGLQASGKSTYYQEYFSLTHLLISKDLMRNVKRKERRQRELLHRALLARHSVVIDNTNPTPNERIPLIEIAHEYGAAVSGYYFATTTQQALMRNQQREESARVPLVAMYSTATRMVPPTYAEGFDKIYYVQIAEHSTLTQPIWIVKEISDGKRTVAY